MVYVNQGDEFNLTCSAQGGPNNVHQWSHDNTDVFSIISSSSDTMSESVLSVTSVDAAIHQGIYICNVSNVAGYEANTSRVVGKYIHIHNFIINAFMSPPFLQYLLLELCPQHQIM